MRVNNVLEIMRKDKVVAWLKALEWHLAWDTE
jgi:hypothetical protein